MPSIAPFAHLLHSYASQPLTWPKVLAELVDNSFDAGANRVTITCDNKNKSVVVADDGHGVKDVLSLVTLGKHVEHRTTKLGTYGVGAKDAWLWCGGLIGIDTVHAGKRITLRVDCKDILARGSWDVDDPIVADSTAQPYTKLTLALRNGKHQPSDEAFDRLRFIFTPALRNGLQLLRATGRNSRPLIPYQLPRLQQVVSEMFDIDGKSVLINIGILPDGEKMPNGPFWMIYGHRIIDHTTCGASNGATTYQTRHVGGEIVLGKGWKLTKNKDDLADLKERLNDEIFVRIEGLLQSGATLSENVELECLRTSLEASLNSTIRAVAETKKEKRNKGTSSGSIEPASSGRRRKTATQTQDGPGGIEVAAASRRRGFALDFANDDTPNAIGRFDYNGSRVCLNLTHPFIASAKQADNRTALVTCALLLIANYGATHDCGNRLFDFGCNDVADAFGRLALDLRLEDSGNGK